MDRRFFNRAGFGLFAGLAALLSASAKADDDKAPKKDDDDDDDTHTLVLSVTSGERQTQQLVLGNAANYAAYYKAKSEPFRIEIVAFGPGYQMVRADMSMMKGEIAALQESLGSALTISACQNSRKAIAAEMGKKPEDIPQLPGVKDTPAGIVRVAALQEDGYAYVRP